MEYVLERAPMIDTRQASVPDRRRASVPDRLKRLIIVLSVLAVLYLAFVGFLSLIRGTPVRLVLAEGERKRPPSAHDSLFARSIELFTGMQIDPGNRVQQLNNGSVYDSLWHDLRAARQTITVQMYFSLPGRVADTLNAVLRERARAGVRVLLLMDAFGSQHLSRE